MMTYPSWSQWKQFIVLLPPSHLFTCILCGVPVRLDQRDTITLGTRIKRWEEVEDESGATYLISKIVPVTHQGLGCPECQWQMALATADEMGRFAADEAGYTADAHDIKKRRLIKALKIHGPSRRVASIDVTNLVLEIERPAAPAGTRLADARGAE